MIKCDVCNKLLVPSFFAVVGSNVCVLCSKDEPVEVEPKEKHTYEVVEDKGCAGGACTL